MEEKIKWKDLKFETENYIYDFQQYETIKIYHCKAIIVEAEEDQSNLLENLVKFNNKSRLKREKVRINKDILMKVRMFFMKVEN